MRSIFLGILGVFFFFPKFIQAVDGLKVADGFEISIFSGPDLANDIYCLHIDADGRVLVASRGYVRHLIDDNTDGQADRAVEVIPAPKQGPMGLLWEKEQLWVVSDGGLYRYDGVDGNSTAKTRGQLILKLRTGGEHDAHAIRRGPDGYLYWLVGNMAGVTEKTVQGENSPRTKPIAGCLLRLNDDASEVQILADGFRNAYDFDFSLAGTPHTYDSDNERCVGLPWYEFTRFYAVYPGGHHGWLNPQFTQTWRLPPYFPDVVTPLCTVGRGSPTGVACYRHSQFPKSYQGNFFLADWTFGKIWQVDISAKTIEPKVFLEATGDNGFAPTGLAVHPRSGDLYISIGGRGTKGSVYRVTAKEPTANAKLLPFQPQEGNVKVPQLEPLPVEPQFFRQAKSATERLTVLRRWHLQFGDLCARSAIGTVYEGYTVRGKIPAKLPQDLVPTLLQAYPANDDNVTRELSRFLALIETDDASAFDKVLAHLTGEAEPAAQIHDLIVLSKLRSSASVTQCRQLAKVLVTLDEKYAAKSLLRDRHWPSRMTEMLRELLAKQPSLAESIVAQPEFGQPDHVWLAGLPGVSAAALAKAMLKQSQTQPQYEWTGRSLQMLRNLPRVEIDATMTSLWQKREWNDTILTLLAKDPQPGDAEKFLAGLRSRQVEVVRVSAAALRQLEYRPSELGPELLPILQSFRRWSDPKQDQAIQKVLQKLLQFWTQQDKLTTAAEWLAWYAQKYPALAEPLFSPVGYDAKVWEKRIPTIAWEAGDIRRGAQIFKQTNCAACHNGAQAVGPSLQGVGQRFSRDDLLTTILKPNQDISPRYRTVRIVTLDERQYEGMVIYEAADGILLQTGSESTVRVAGDTIESKTPGVNSLMPSGLIDGLKNEEIADLMAYLRSLK